eukprot:4462986-Pleurochrysis_carterae.AAC.7
MKLLHAPKPCERARFTCVLVLSRDRLERMTCQTSKRRRARFRASFRERSLSLALTPSEPPALESMRVAAPWQRVCAV